MDDDDDHHTHPPPPPPPPVEQTKRGAQQEEEEEAEDTGESEQRRRRRGKESSSSVPPPARPFDPPPPSLPPSPPSLALFDPESMQASSLRPVRYSDIVCCYAMSGTTFAYAAMRYPVQTSHVLLRAVWRQAGYYQRIPPTPSPPYRLYVSRYDSIGFTCRGTELAKAARVAVLR
eukprot:115770-Rhodomonas_salina.1